LFADCKITSSTSENTNPRRLLLHLGSRGTDTRKEKNERGRERNDRHAGCVNKKLRKDL